MTELFLKIVNMSISASWLILAIIAVRLLLKKTNAPKWLNLLLWGIAGLRLIMPFSIESALSLIPSAETIHTEIMYTQKPTIESGIPAVNHLVNPFLSESFTPVQEASANPLQILIFIAAAVWIIGMILLLAYTGFSYLRLQNRMKTAVLLQGNIYQSENVVSPFVLGLIHPRIYLPFNMTEGDMTSVIAHEQTHILRRDHLTKPIGFLLLTLHWFNPLVWAAYLLFCRDIELACDERVIKTFGAQERADYSQALLNCSVNHKAIAACPIAFGEVGVKERVKHVLNYRKPGFWIVAIALIVSAALAVCFLTDPSNPSKPAMPSDDEKALSLRIVDGADTGKLVLAGEEADKVFTLDLDKSNAEIYLDGKPADGAALENGMMAEIYCPDDWRLQSYYPAKLNETTAISVYSLGTEQNPGGSFYDLCGLYLEVLNDLWMKDSGLNDGAAYVSVDLSKAPGELTDGEKSAIAWIFAGTHNAQGLTLNSEELAENGYLTKVETGGNSDKAPLYRWDDGVLFSITGEEWNENDIFSLPVLKFSAGKWRSPLGAYFFSGCKAVWPAKGKWESYTIGAEAIS